MCTLPHIVQVYIRLCEFLSICDWILFYLLLPVWMTCVLVWLCICVDGYICVPELYRELSCDLSSSRQSWFLTKKLCRPYFFAILELRKYIYIGWACFPPISSVKSIHSYIIYVGDVDLHASLLCNCSRGNFIYTNTKCHLSGEGQFTHCGVLDKTPMNSNLSWLLHV